MDVFCKGKKTMLRKVELADASCILQWKQDELVKEMALDPDTQVTLENQKQDIRRAIDDESQLYLIILVADTNQQVGYIRINWMDSGKRFSWLRFALGAKDARRKGYMQDSLRTLLGYLFGKSMHRAEAEVYEYNKASLGLLEGLGFKREGLKRKAHYDGSRYHDVVVFGLLSGELR
jgi:RimJ/RimL family protein N-acetyltransferase